MPTRRGWAALAAGVFLWVSARLMGSPELHMIAAAVMFLPLLAAVAVQWTHVRIEVRRHLSASRVFPGTRVTVTLTVRNVGRSTVSFLLLEDQIPATLGRPARVVVTGLPSGGAQDVRYSLVCRQRGRFRIGPLSTFVTDPFGLARVKIPSAGESGLIVYPAVEELRPGRLATEGTGAGESTVRYLHRAAAEFYTMREYVTGDDLRRIHWPSVARTGRLMIRQDEATRRSAATIFLDNRITNVGTGGAAFERCVSIAASVGRMLVRAGFVVTIATVDTPPIAVGETALLELLAGVGPARSRAAADVVPAVAGTGRGDATLIVVGPVPQQQEIAPLSRTGMGFGRRMAVLVHSNAFAGLPPPRAAEQRARGEAVATALRAGGWDVHVMEPDGRLTELWESKTPRRFATASSS